MSSRIQLIVGLANPGKEYADTRHNAGAWFVEEIISTLSPQPFLILKREKKFHGDYGQATLFDKECHVLIPTTYMNLSGQAVGACANYYNIPTDAILVAHDDIDLPVGTIKLKVGGGDGGHNGLKDIINHLSSREFYRLRIGVGRPGNSKDVVDYVLQNPSKADRKKINQALEKAIDILPLLMQGEMQKAMQQLHTET